MKVLKFGGTSVGSAERIKHVAAMLRQCNGDIVVLSAMSGTTNALIEISSRAAVGAIREAKALTNELRAKYTDVVTSLFDVPEQRDAAWCRLQQSFDLIEDHIAGYGRKSSGKEIIAQGELMSTALMHEYLTAQGIDAVMLPALDYMRVNEAGEPASDDIRELLRQLLASNTGNRLYITQGFICRDHNGLITTLTRGGSDYTATLVGAAVEADEIQIWTDIDGIHNNDPRYVERTHSIPRLHFKEASSLAYYGAKILHPDCVRPAQQKHIPIRLLDTMNPTATGTVISDDDSGIGIKAVAAKDGIAVLYSVKEPDTVLLRSILEKNHIHQFEITRHCGILPDKAGAECTTYVTFTDDGQASDIFREFDPGIWQLKTNATLIGIVGEPHDTERAMAVIEEALAGIPVYRPIRTDEHNGISVVISSADKTRALRALSTHLFDNNNNNNDKI